MLNVRIVGYKELHPHVHLTNRVTGLKLEFGVLPLDSLYETDFFFYPRFVCWFIILENLKINALKRHLTLFTLRYVSCSWPYAPRYLHSEQFSVLGTCSLEELAKVKLELSPVAGEM